MEIKRATHPFGQTLVVTAGCGRIQRWSASMEEIRPGDVVWIELTLPRSRNSTVHPQRGLIKVTDKQYRGA